MTEAPRVLHFSAFIQIAIIYFSELSSSTSTSLPSASAALAANPPKKQKYCIRYTGNSSKRWDGKEIWVDGEWLEGLYKPSELTDGHRIRLPWQGKRGHVTYWDAVIVDTEKPQVHPSALVSVDKSAQPTRKRKRKASG